MSKVNLETSWEEWGGEIVPLTDDELKWFYSLVDLAKKATGYTKIRISAYNHSLYPGKHKNSIGICCLPDVENPAEDEDTFITIDTLHIHLNYDNKFNNWPLIAECTIEETIAHELAHLTYWRHGKKHTAKTQELLDLILEAENEKSA